ncbi:O-antigen ligase family protein [Devosia psychrophila]|uniref:O-antigen ligase n=1 Tax=Devosia psychrophila TaxID=728005 RepID=A0A0F5Q219_9HYPH|nr:O-antigen ligase family protein [Devosia psychrophila]KKC34958.1 hypothetical protein WH91_00070 [Devosia psychrophila]SFD46247.1 O-antigen ligase [Devosia psychrophila]
MSDGLQNRAEVILSSALTRYGFAFSIVGLTFKQLQFAGGFGLMEIAAAAFCALIGVAYLLSRQKIPMHALGVAGGIFAVFMLGAIVAILTDPQRLSIRDTIAYTFTFAIVCAFILASRNREMAYIKALAIAINVCLAVFAVLAIIPSPAKNLMYYMNSDKLQGLSNNPNQIAFLAAVGLSLLIAIELCGGNNRSWGLIALSAACGLAGAMSGSAAFTFAVGGTFVLALIIAGIQAFKRTSMRLPLTICLPFVLAILFTVPLPNFLGTWVGPSPSEVSQLPATANSDPVMALLESDGGQGAIRMTLWKNAISVFASSPIFGMGPGPHVPLMLSDSSTVTLNEAHNTPIDILVVSGILGFLAFSGLSVWVLINAVEKKTLGGVMVSVAPVALFMLLHYEARQPLFWIVIFFVANALPKVIGKEASAPGSFGLSNSA